MLLLAMRLSYSLNYSSILCLRRRDQHIGVMEYWVPIYSIIDYRTFIFQPKIRSLGKGR